MELFAFLGKEGAMNVCGETNTLSTEKNPVGAQNKKETISAARGNLDTGTVP